MIAPYFISVTVLNVLSFIYFFQVFTRANAGGLSLESEIQKDSLGLRTLFCILTDLNTYCTPFRGVRPHPKLNLVLRLHFKRSGEYEAPLYCYYSHFHSEPECSYLIGFKLFKGYYCYEYLIPFNCVQIICIKKSYLRLHMFIKDYYLLLWSFSHQC